MSTDVKAIIKRKKQRHRAWLNKAGNRGIWETDLRSIDQALERADAGRELNLADSLTSAGNWHAVNGLIALCDCLIHEGWKRIHTAWLYESMALRFRISEFRKGRVLGPFRPLKSLTLETNASALCLAYALVVRRQFEMEFFGDAVRMMIMDNDAVPESHWEYHSVPSFMVQLLALLRRERLDGSRATGRDLGAYQAIIDAWNEPSALGEALYNACDFHCQRIEDNSDEFFAEFRDPPFDLVPAEILAVYSVRNSLGLDTPSVEHPLLVAPFNTPMGNPSEIEDPLLDRVEAVLVPG
jgi:hypothetical protein